MTRARDLANLADGTKFTADDHTKLDAIEASADVTDTANVTAAGALMDSELTNLAAVKAINQSLVTTASPQFAGLNFDAASGADAQVHMATDSNSRGFYVDESDANSMKFYTGYGKGVAGREVTFDNFGNVGIGTASPLRQLHISNTSANSEIAFTAGTSGTSSLLFGDGLTGVDVYKGYLQYQHNGDYMLLATAGATVVRLDSDGLKFGADSAAANALSDYEEGTATLQVRGANGDPSTAQYLTGKYRKVGTMCHFQVQKVGNLDLSGAAGPMYLTGMPFAAVGNSLATLFSYKGLNFTNNPQGHIGGNAIYIYQNISGAVATGVNINAVSGCTIELSATIVTA